MQSVAPVTIAVTSASERHCYAWAQIHYSFTYMSARFGFLFKPCVLDQTHRGLPGISYPVTQARLDEDVKHCFQLPAHSRLVTSTMLRPVNRACAASGIAGTRVVAAAHPVRLHTRRHCCRGRWPSTARVRKGELSSHMFTALAWTSWCRQLGCAPFQGIACARMCRQVPAL